MNTRTMSTLLTTLFLATACGPEGDHDLAHQSLTEDGLLTALVDMGRDAATFRMLLERTGLEAKLDAEQPATLFLPPEETLRDYLHQNEWILEKEAEPLLVDLVSYPFAPGVILTSDLREGTLPSALPSASIEVTDFQVRLADELGRTVDIVDGDRGAGASVIHLVDGVMFPGLDVLGQLRRSGYVLFADALRTSGLLKTIPAGAPVTVLAMEDLMMAKHRLTSNDMSDQDLAQALAAHVIVGRLSGVTLAKQEQVTLAGEKLSLQVEADGATVHHGLQAAKLEAIDVMAFDGVIHQVDRPLF